ncbi:hypothetical protein D3C78_1527490 [compost metagenome]
MDISGRDMHIGYEIVFGIHRAVVQIKEAFWFSIPDHISTVWIRLTYFNFFFFVHFLSRF